VRRTRTMETMPSVVDQHDHAIIAGRRGEPHKHSVSVCQ